MAPGLPTASVPTGIPAGICDVASDLSMPFTNVCEGKGTPSTGTNVLEAITPARCAALPAAAIKICTPFFSEALIYSKSASGVRCAESARASWGTFNSSKVKLACSMIVQSDLDPMIMLISICDMTPPEYHFVFFVFAEITLLSPSLSSPKTGGGGGGGCAG